MKKRIVFPTKFLLAAIVIVLSSCEMRGIRGSGHVTTENRQITGDFKSIEAGNGLDVVIQQSDKTAITVEADDNLQKHIITKIENGILIIKSDSNSYDNATKKVTVQMPVLESLEATSGVSVTSSGMLHGKSIAVNSSSGATVEISIEADKARCEASSGSDIKIGGKAIEFETATSSGSNINAEKLLSNNVTASASSGSKIDVYPLVSLNAEASSGANINYHHTPASIKQDENSGGSISKE